MVNVTSRKETHKFNNNKNKNDNIFFLKKITYSNLIM